MLNKKKNKFTILLIIGAISIFFILLNYNNIETFQQYFFSEKSVSKNEFLCGNCNVILIAIDDLRPDHLGCYGYYRNTSPNIDRFADESIVFKQTISQAPYSAPSYMSIFTSLYPYVHQMTFNNIDKRWVLSKSITTFAEILKKNNYSTASFINNIWLSPYFGYSRGFDLYDEENNSIDTNKDVFKWLAENKNSKFFLFLHYNDVHDPYIIDEEHYKLFDENYTDYLSLKNLAESVDETCGFCYGNLNTLIENGSFSERDKEVLIAAIDGKIKYTDENIGELLNKIDELGLTKNSIIILIADHGEALMEHGLIGHRYQLYDEEIRVPFIMKYPNIDKRIINNQTQLIDILPTVLDSLNIEIPNQLQGESLLPLIEGKDNKDRTAYSELDNLVSVRTSNFKLIYDKVSKKKLELYNLNEDPKEQRNIINNSIDIANMLEERVIEWMKLNNEKKESLDNNETITEINETIKQEIREKLKDLGYIV